MGSDSVFSDSVGKWGSGEVIQEVERFGVVFTTQRDGNLRYRDNLAQWNSTRRMRFAYNKR